MVQTAGAAPQTPDPPQLVQTTSHSLSLAWEKRDGDDEFELLMEDPLTVSLMKLSHFSKLQTTKKKRKTNSCFFFEGLWFFARLRYARINLCRTKFAKKQRVPFSVVRKQRRR